jgi:hypothetical protein
MKFWTRVRLRFLRRRVLQIYADAADSDPIMKFDARLLAAPYERRIAQLECYLQLSR